MYHLNKAGRLARCAATVQDCRFAVSNFGHIDQKSYDRIRNNLPFTEQERAIWFNLKENVSKEVPFERHIVEADEESLAVMEELYSLPISSETKEKSSPIHKQIYKAYVRLCDDNGLTPKVGGYIANIASYNSKVGNFMEQALQAVVNYRINEGQSDLNEYYSGSVIQDELKTVRKELKATSNAYFDRYVYDISTKYHMSEEYVSNILKSKNTISIPDEVGFKRLDDQYTVVRVAEAKLSGELDSTNLPGNVKKIREFSVQPWNDVSNILMEKRIVLTATLDRGVDSPTRFPLENRWKMELAKPENKGIKILSNENAFSWILGAPSSKEDYQKAVIDNVTNYTAKRLVLALNGEEIL